MSHIRLPVGYRFIPLTAEHTYATHQWIWDGIVDVRQETDLHDAGWNMPGHGDGWAHEFHNPNDSIQRLGVVLHGEDGSLDTVVAYAGADMPATANLTTAGLYVRVRPTHRRQGLGGSLLGWVQEIASQAGRSALTGTSTLPELRPGQPSLNPATGVGQAALTDGVVFLSNRGWALEQVERRSALTLPVDPDLLDRLLGQAQAKAQDYRIHHFDTVPAQQWLDQYATLMSAMDTDAPSGDLEWEEDAWDGHKVRKMFQDLLDTGYAMSLVIAEHIPIGSIAGASELIWHKTPGYPVEQEDTIVLEEHRGHRLGMLLKVSNLQHLARMYPQAPLVSTHNAEENSHMLAINIALGFVPAGGEAEFQIRL